jgi:UDP-N-acetyl-D-mannosaminuronic acid dehydrogenase
LGTLKGKKIAALGLAYKADVDDLRESPAIEVVHLLQRSGAQVKAWEPFRRDAKVEGIDLVPSLEAAIEDADILLLLVKHTELMSLIPHELAARSNARVVVDCVNGWNSKLWENAGFTVYRLGVNR